MIYLTGSVSLVQILSITHKAVHSLTYFLLFSSPMQGRCKLHRSLNPLPFHASLFPLMRPFHLDLTLTLWHSRADARPGMDITFSLKPSWTWPLYWEPRALGPRLAMSTVTVLPCLARGFLRTVIDVFTVSAFT